MPLISSTIPNLINGVSQQPAALRLSSQAESVVNCMSSPVEGLKKRPPMNHVARLFTGSAGSTRPFTHIVDRDGNIQYLILIQDGAIKVFDPTHATHSDSAQRHDVPGRDRRSVVAVSSCVYC